MTTYSRASRLSRNCQFAFVKFPGPEHVTDILKDRLDRTFEAFGLRSSDYCVFLPRLDAASFFAAMGTSDIFLDSIGWSGCNSTLESLRHALPIVTLPENLMRSRHTAAILKMIGLTETITTTTKEYVTAAINLATSDVLRAKMRTKIFQKQTSRVPRQDLHLCPGGLSISAGLCRQSIKVTQGFRWIYISHRNPTRSHRKQCSLRFRFLLQPR